MRNRVHSSRLRITLAGALTLALPAIGMSPAFAQTAGPSAPMTVPAGQVSQPEAGGVNWQGVGYGAGTLAANVLYVPAKLAYAICGGIIGGGAWALTGGNTQTANTIWRSSLGGDYAVTPDMIAGKQQLHFTGPTSTAPVSQTAATGTVRPIEEIPPNAPAPASNTSMMQETTVTASSK
jgi:hypothetical protein